jgi:aerobic-type carbon monoxide dehydrogenase small subunit (CoxS/CutS family)
VIVTVNGRPRDVDGAALDRGLLGWLREDCDLTGAKDGCGIGVCGACTVLVDLSPVKACNLTVRDVAGKGVLTIEGMAGADGALHPLQQAFIEHGAIQCGYCTPGMVLTAHAFLLKNHAPTRDQVRRAINPNLCRCTGYQQIVDAIEAAARHYPPAR